jgi:hypothetical protein
MAILVAVVVKEFWMGLTRKQFNEVALVIFKHTRGFGTLPRKRSAQYRKILWSRSHHGIQASQHRR